MNHSTTNTDICKSLLRGELHAIKAYSQAIEEFADNSVTCPLKHIRADHKASAALLLKIIRGYGHDPDNNSGPWSAFPTALERGEALSGESHALIVLQHEETLGITAYEKALDHDALEEAVKDLICNDLLPALRDHLVELERRKSKAA
jgi:hypothetical protein